MVVLRALRAVHCAFAGPGPQPAVPSSSGVDTAKASSTEKPESANRVYGRCRAVDERIMNKTDNVFGKTEDGQHPVSCSRVHG